MFKAKIFQACTFQGLGAKRQKYLDLLAEKMSNKGFQLVEETESSIRERTLLGDSNLIFKSPDETFKVGIQAVSTNGDLQVGFASAAKEKQINVIFVISVVLAFVISASLASIIKYLFPSIDVALLGTLTLIVFFSILFGPISFIAIKDRLTWTPQIKQILIETAKSLGSKQITPFKPRKSMEAAAFFFIGTGAAFIGAVFAYEPLRIPAVWVVVFVLIATGSYFAYLAYKK